MIPVLAVAGGSLVALLLVWMLAAFVSMAFSGDGYTGKHRVT